MKKRPINIINEQIILPLSDIITKQEVSSSLKFLMKSQWWSESNLKAYQDEKLRQLIKHSYTNVPYYNELFKSLKLTPADFKTSEDLLKLPILTKETIRENFANKKIIATNIPRSSIIPSHSSGSTAEPLKYYNTKEAWGFNLACAIRAWYWMGYTLGDKYVKISQHKRASFKKTQDFFNRCKYLSAEQLNEEYFNNIVNVINSYKPKIVRGYVDQILFLANFVHEHNLKFERPFNIATTGSTLHQSRRKIIETYLDCKIYDSYRCEGGANVSECEDHGSYHSSMEYAITEIMANNIEVHPGEQGRLVTTDLINYAVPFIRYDTQDLVTKAKTKCKCGRELLSIEKIHGRDSDILITPSGKFLIYAPFDAWFPKLDTVRQFQIIQDRIDHIIIRLSVNDNFNNAEEDKILKYWQDFIGNDTNVEIQVVDDIPLTSSGKRRYLIRDKSIILPF